MIRGDFDVYVARWKTRHTDVFEGLAYFPTQGPLGVKNISFDTAYLL